MDILSHTRPRGFTLIEVLVTMTIAAILGTTAVPAFHSMLQRNKIASEINTFVTHLNYARSEAIMQSTRVVMCRSRDGKTCQRTNGWHEGWITFADKNANRERDDDEVVLRVVADYKDNGVLITSGRRRRVVFQTTGFTPGTNATYTFCDPDYPEFAKAIILSNSGRARLSLVKPNGKPLDCG